jgi:carbon storage regulator
VSKFNPFYFYGEKKIMLVLSRYLDEKIILSSEFLKDNPIEITIVEVIGNKVKIGINAPKNIEVDRKEIYDSKKRCKKAG